MTHERTFIFFKCCNRGRCSTRFRSPKKLPPTANTHCLFKRHHAADNNAKCVGRSVPDANPCNYNSGFWNSATPEPEANVKILAYEFHTREPTMLQRTGTRMTDPKHDRDATWLMSTPGDGNAKHAEEARLVFRSPKRSWLFRRHCDAVTRDASTTTVQNPCENNSKKCCLTHSRALYRSWQNNLMDTLPCDLVLLFFPLEH